jgi:predicted ester cyclase
MQTQQAHRGKRRNRPDGVALNLLASALSILTAIALLGAATVFADTSATVVAPERHEHVIHDFYRAVNEVLRSSDATALDRIVAPDLVFHPPSARIAPNRAGLERYLTGIHDTFPAFQIRVEDVVSDGDRAVARVAGGSETPGGFLGLCSCPGDV